MHLNKHTETIVNTATTYTSTGTVHVNGLLHMIRYERSTSAPISSTADLTIKTKNSVITLLDSLAIGGASFNKIIRSSVVNTTNATISGVAGFIPVVEDVINITIAKCTSINQTGTFHFFFEGN